jgi:predicted RNase H-like HicB family nuclease
VRVAVILERGGGNIGAWVPELPGCVAVGKTEDEVLTLIREAIELHLRELRAGGESAPEPSTRVMFVETPDP